MKRFPQHAQMNVRWQKRSMMVNFNICLEYEIIRCQAHAHWDKYLSQFEIICSSVGPRGKWHCSNFHCVGSLINGDSKFVDIISCWPGGEGEQVEAKRSLTHETGQRELIVFVSWCNSNRVKGSRKILLRGFFPLRGGGVPPNSAKENSAVKQVF